MKNLFYFFFVSLFFFGCSKDEDVKSEAKSISVGGKDYAFKGAGVIDYGYDSYWEEYTKEFVLTNDAITSGKEITDYSYALYFQANVAHTEFAYGTFYDDENKDQYGGVMFIENGNPNFMTSGSFSLSKESNGDLSITVDGILMDGKKLNGTYTAPFSTLSEEFVENLFSANLRKSATFKVRK